MEYLPLSLCVIFGIIIVFLLIKQRSLKKSLDEISESFKDKLSIDTNTLIDVSVRDRHVRALANKINVQLRLLRDERRRFQHGDNELKEAVTNISHDLRTPLTAICGYLDLLEREEKSEEVNRYIAMISNRTESLKQLTEELFRYSVISSVQDESVEQIILNDVLEESLVASYAAMQQSKIVPEIFITDTKVERKLNRSAVSRIFGNIITNALKYSDGDFCVSMEDSGKIVFSNAAHGLTPVMAGRLFDRFYTVETGRNSTGLGLSIAKLLTERMGGTIEAEYNDDKLYITIQFVNRD